MEEVYSVQVGLSGFSVRSLCFVQAKILCSHGCMYSFAVLVFVCVDDDVICVAHELNRTSGGGVISLQCKC